jgi:hypothetical protein
MCVWVLSKHDTRVTRHRLCFTETRCWCLTKSLKYEGNAVFLTIFCQNALFPKGLAISIWVRFVSLFMTSSHGPFCPGGRQTV